MATGKGLEAGAGIEPALRDLQSRALPLCYPAEPSRDRAASTRQIADIGPCPIAVKTGVPAGEGRSSAIVFGPRGKYITGCVYPGAGRRRDRDRGPIQEP